MSILRTIARERTNTRTRCIDHWERGFVHGNSWRVLSITDDGPVQLYEGEGRISARLLRDLVDEYRTADNEICIEGRYDWSPSLWEWTRNGEYEIGEYWQVDLSRGLSLNWT